MSRTVSHSIAGVTLRIRGLVQGVGFRPFIWRLAHEHQLAGRVLNDGSGVLIEVWGEPQRLDAFIRDIPEQCPPLARIDHVEQQPLQAQAGQSFEIVDSRQSDMQTGVAADAVICQACLDDINDPLNRRYRYAFTNCTHCGPRLSIINSIPYDRCHTSMAKFQLCDDCQAEYDNPADRRFHAQPNACPLCGPRLWLEPAADFIEAADDIERAAELIRQGMIVAIKGIGGFHLACDALNEQAVSRLRRNKQRDAKPFALMARSVEMIRQYCRITDYEADLLASPQAPIVLLDKKSAIARPLASQIAPEQSVLGFMLPYTALHTLLMQAMDGPLVMTSANLSDLPQCIDNDQARRQLTGLADYFLMHDRDILHRLDDSVVRVINDQCQVMRRARGYTPQAIVLPQGFENGADILAMGGELKNTFCLIKDGQAVLSQHMGDLENAAVLSDYEKAIKLYRQLFNHRPEILAVDAHPEYISSKLGRQLAVEYGIEPVAVQHHHAHIAACLADNDWPLTGGKVLGIVLDGLGFGQDGELWGGEFLLADYSSSIRLATMRPVALIGGAQAMREPWRNTYAHLQAAFDWAELQKRYAELELIQFLQSKPLATIDSMLAKNINTPLASSCGRLFDAVAAAIGLCRNQISYEGQAAMALENCITEAVLISEKNKGYPFVIDSHSEIPRLLADDMWRALLDDLQHGVAAAVIASRFHLGLAQGLVDMVLYLSSTSQYRAIDPAPHPKAKFFNKVFLKRCWVDGEDEKENPVLQDEVLGLQTKETTVDTIALSGGVFQNRVLFQLLDRKLKEAGFNVLSHRRVPANDGGLAFGQAMVALARTMKEKTECV